MDSLIVIQLGRDESLVERIVIFDRDDELAALAELGRLDGAAGAETA